VEEHAAVVEAIAAGNGDAAYEELKGHISRAFEARLRQDAEDAAKADAANG
jgi:DNA-binding GntR family transcriptional regulator